MTDLPKNVFFDINKLPKEYGLLVFPISMSRATTSQSPQKYLEFMRHFSPSKVTDSKIGANIIYSDYLYLYSKKPAVKLRNQYAEVAVDHKNAFTNLIKKYRNEFQIQHAFAFQTWNDQYLRYEGDFFHKLLQFKKWALKDKLMMKFIKDDCKHWKFKMTKEQVDFYLEEHLMLYFISKGQLKLPNDYVSDRQEWILWCYPGILPKALAYTYQKNYFSLENPINKYENCTYDLESKKLVDFMRIDLRTYDYKYDN